MNIPLKRSRFVSIVTLLNLAAIITSAGMSSGCGGKTEPKVMAAGPVTVVVADIVQKTVPIFSEYVGQTDSNTTVELRARVEGILEKINFKEGQPVKKRQLLFVIDKRPFQASLQSAKADEAKAKSDLAQAQQRTDVIQAQSQLADAEAVYAKAKSDLDRLTPLAKEKAVTQLELDAAIAAEKSAQATVDARKANLKNVEDAVQYTIARAQAGVSNAQAKVTQAQLELSYCTIYSPINGIIGFKKVDVGNLVGHDSLLTTVSNSDPLLVNFNMSETEYLDLTGPGGAGQHPGSIKFQLILSNDSIHPYPGTFKVVDRTVDPQTGTMKVQTSFPNPRSYLRPGQFAKVRAPVAVRKDAILVPQRAIQEVQGSKTVMVVDDENKVSVRTLTLGEKSDQNYIVLQGLSAGERVIVEGMQKVTPGSEVIPTTAPTPAPSTGATPAPSTGATTAPAAGESSEKTRSKRGPGTSDCPEGR
jgi:membrane fusion protein (multidrug efflux system)